MPSVSVIIPVYNGERYLRDALESVFAQTHPASEVIVADDGSSDESASVAEGFAPRVSVIRQENGGAGSARNTGVRHAIGVLPAFLDWYARARDLGLRMESLPDVLVRRRLHTHNLTGSQDTRTAYFSVLREALRRRSTNG